MRALWTGQIKKNGTNLYELALAIKKWPQADEVARRVLLYCRDAESFSMLAAVANKLGRKARLKALSVQAKKLLPEAELQKVHKL